MIILNYGSSFISTGTGVNYYRLINLLLNYPKILSIKTNSTKHIMICTLQKILSFIEYFHHLF